MSSMFSFMKQKTVKHGLKIVFCLLQPVPNERDGISSKQIKITTANSMLQSRVRVASW